MATIPAGATILTLEEALGYHRSWSSDDRATAAEWIARTGVTEFYVPPSGGYVAGHGGPNRGFHDQPVNGLVMHVGFLHAWPNQADYGEDERIELSNSRGETSRGSGSRASVLESSGETCPNCHLLISRTRPDECDICGYDFAAARAASIARWHEAQRRRTEGQADVTA